MRAVRKKCSFSAIADQCCLPDTAVWRRQLAAMGVWQLQFKHCFLGHWPCTRLGRERWEVGSLCPCEYVLSEELAVSGQGKAAAAKRKLPSSKKGWREVDWMTVKGRVWVENVLAVAHKCAAPSFESAAMAGKLTVPYLG